MDKRNKQCIHCGDEFEQDPRVKNQEYCSKEKCRLARRRIWQKKKMREDPVYKENQQDCWKEWYERHPSYYKKYRKKNPQYTTTNRARQKLRDIRRRKNGFDNLLVKMDSIGSRLLRRNWGTFKLIPKGSEMLAKMDSMTVELIPV